MRLVSFFTLLVLVTVARSQTVPAPVAFNPALLGPAASPAILGPAAGSLPSFFGPATTPTILSPAIAPAILGPAAGSLPSILSPASLPSFTGPATASLPSFVGPASTPSILSPASVPSLLGPSGPTDLSPECIDEFGAYTSCLFANLGCLDSCSSIGSDNSTASDTTACDDVDAACQFVTCCSPCVSTGKAYIECESSTRGCNKDCSNIAPVAPSPVPPTSPSTQDFCMELALSWTACLINNADSCDGSNCTALESPDSTICEDLTSLCTPLTCCDPCSNEGKALGACYSDIFQCESDCGSYSPVAPSAINITLPPALNFPPSMMIPTTTTTASPAAPSTETTTAAPASVAPVDSTTSAPAAPSNDATTDAPVSDAPVVPTTAGNTTKAPTVVNGTKAPTSAAYQSTVTSMSIAVLVSVVSAIALQSYMI